jgi:AcrR family transcriptional regulator
MRASARATEAWRMVPMTPSTESRIYDAALQLFATHGFEATGIRQIAEAAGITTSTLYHYVQGKEDLLNDIAVGGMRALAEAAERVLEAAEDPRAQLGGLIRLHVWVHGRRALAARVADVEIRSMHGKQRDYLMARRDAYELLWREVLQRGVDEGVFRVRRPRLATTALLTMATGVAHWYREDGPSPLEEICDDFAEWGFALVGADLERSWALLSELEPPASYYVIPQVPEASVGL